MWWDLKVHYSVQKTPPLVPFLSRITPAHTIPPRLIYLRFVLMRPVSAVSPRFNAASVRSEPTFESCCWSTQLLPVLTLTFVKQGWAPFFLLRREEWVRLWGAQIVKTRTPSWALTGVRSGERGSRCRRMTLIEVYGAVVRNANITGALSLDSSLRRC
jgi:hypothetical protein